MPDHNNTFGGIPMDDPTEQRLAPAVGNTFGGVPVDDADPATQARTGQLTLTPDTYIDFATREIEELQARAGRLGLEPLSDDAQLVIVDKWRVGAGLDPVVNRDPDQMLRAQLARRARLNEANPLFGFSSGVGRTLNAAGADIAGLVDPDTGQAIDAAARRYFGDVPDTAAGKIGSGLGEAAVITASLPAGPAGVAGIMGARGAGGVRREVDLLRDDGREVSTMDEWTTALQVGAAEAASGYIGARIFGAMGRQLRALAPEAQAIAQKEGGAAAREFLKRQLMRGGVIAGGSAAEGTEEAVTNIVTNALRKAGVNPDQDIYEGVAESAAMGAALAPFLGPIAGGINAGKSPQVGPKLSDEGTRRRPPRESRRQQVARLEAELAETRTTLEGERKLARTDPLTKIGNRQQEQEDIARLTQEADQSGESLGFVETDLSNFKVLNDVLGHEVGDQVLIAEAESIREALRQGPRRAEGQIQAAAVTTKVKGDKRAGEEPRAAESPGPDFAGSVNRVGGDEFPVKLRNITDPAQADAVMRRANGIFREKLNEIIGDKLPEQAYPFIAWGTEIRKPGDTRSAKELTVAAEQKVLPNKNALKDELGVPRDREGLAKFVEEHASQKQADPATPSQVAQAASESPQSLTPSQAAEIARTGDPLARFRTRQPDPAVKANAADYAQRAGLSAAEYTGYAPVNEERAKQIADAYEAMDHRPDDPEVRRSYDALKKETLDQWRHLQQQGVVMEPWTEEGQPYADSAEMRADVAQGHLYFFTGGDMPSNHPLAEAAPDTDGLTYNDVLRAVHDYYGHAKEGYEFGPRGEDNAWRSHAALYSDAARPALTTETRGQNSWVNFGPFGKQNRADPANTVYAEQKAGLLPSFVYETDDRSTGDVTNPNVQAEATGLPLDPGAMDGPLTEAAAPRSGIADDVSGIRKMWRSAVTAPSRALNSVPEHHPIGRLRTTLGAKLSDDYARPEGWSTGRRQARGRTNLVKEDAERLAKRFTKLAKESGLDPDNGELHLAVEMAVRGKMPIESVPESMRPWVQQARALLDAESRYAADIFDAAGLESTAATYRANIGSYLANVPISAVSTKGRTKEALRRLLGERVSDGFRKVKRDKWMVVDGRKILGKFETQEEATTAYNEAVEKRKTSLIGSEALKSKRLTPDDLNKKAAGQLEVLEPISEEWRREHEIHDPRYLVAKSIIEARHNAEMVKMFHTAARIWGKDADAALGKGASDADIAEWAKTNGLKQLPKQGSLHDLSGQYVPEAIADDLTDMARVPSDLERAYLAFLSTWKASKTIWNPATHMRNVYGNALIFSNLANTSVFNPANYKFYRDAVTQLSKKGEDYRALVEEGVLGSEFYGAEIARIEKEMRGLPETETFRWFAGLKTAQSKLGDLYAAEDQVFKMAAYLKYRSQGMEATKAAAEVDKWFPNYARVSKVTRWLRNSPVGSPFISFFDQSLRIAGRGIKEKPLTTVKLASIPAITSYLSALMIGMSPDEQELVDEGRSYWEPVLPFRGPNGQAMTLDLRYIVPLANDILPQERNGSTIVPWMFSGPLANLAIEQLSGKERFSGRELATDDEGRITLEARMASLANTTVPFPTIATYGVERVANAHTNQSDESLANAIIGSLFGANIRSPYIARDKVEDIARNMIAEGDLGQAQTLLRVWNSKYKPGNQRSLEFPTVAGGIKRRGQSARRQAMNEAAEHLLSGRDARAQEIIRRYNRDERRRTDAPLTITEARYQSAKLRRQGRTR